MDRVDCLIVGSGGREHAIAWKMAQAARIGKLYVAPGNAGTALVAENVPIAADDIDGLLAFANEHEIGLTIVGPEAPLAAGIVDQFQNANRPIFGPTRAAAKLESSKAYAKAFMQEFGIPTGHYAAFTEVEHAYSYIDGLPETGLVVKASGLAAGKGVLMCKDKAEARTAVDQIVKARQFGDAGNVALVEERLYGPEVSIIALSDGKTVVPLAPSRDHKRAFDHDQGPNTGGMGVYAPPLDIDADLVAQITKTILQPTVDGMAKRGTPFVGVLYAGIMLTDRGPRVLEFNCRFGDPETQVILPLLDADLLLLIEHCLSGTLSAEMVKVSADAAVGVVCASEGYPGPYPKGLPISGLDTAAALDNVVIFHAGTAADAQSIVTHGGRVLAVVARAESLDQAAKRAYHGVDAIGFDGMHFRTDIAKIANSLS